MSKLGGLFGRKAGLYDRPAEATAAKPHLVTDKAAPAALSKPVTPPENPLELDEELFSTLGAQIGSENEVLRNLLLHANAKINELDTIKAAVGKLVDPIEKALRAFEAEQAEKAGLQAVLSNTRTAYGKLRNEAAEFERRASSAEKEVQALRQELTATHTLLRTAEATKAEIAIDVAAGRAKIAELESRLLHESGESKALREENRRLDERLAATDKRVIAIESDLNSARQRLMMAEDEKRAQQAAFEKASTEAARLSRKLAETEAALATVHGRLRQVEANFTEVNTERTRISAALDEANERFEHEISTQRMRFDTLQARASATEKLLGEAREHLLARAEEIRDYDRRVAETALELDAAQARIAAMEAERTERESQLQELGQTRSTLIERTTALTRAYTNKEAALERAEHTIATLGERITELENSSEKELYSAEKKIEELTAGLRRERMERSVVEGALETARKDFSRVMRDLMALQRNQQAAEEQATPSAANAA